MSPAIHKPTEDDASPPPSPNPSATTKHNLFPNPLFRLELRDLSHPGTHAFLSSTPATSVLATALSTVFTHLYQARPAHHAPSDAPSHSTAAAVPIPYASHPVPQTRSITLILRSMPGVAHTTALSLDASHKQIHLSLDYIASLPPARLTPEILGVLTHEVVHCVQWDGEGTAPGGLIEGVADWVRLRAGLKAEGWRREAGKQGRKWDEGYATTGWFLEWMEGACGEGVVGRVNERLRGVRYEEEGFWKGVGGVGRGVEELWGEYGRWLEERKGKDGEGDGNGGNGMGADGKEKDEKEAGGADREGENGKGKDGDGKDGECEDADGEDGEGGDGEGGDGDGTRKDRDEKEGKASDEKQADGKNANGKSEIDTHEESLQTNQSNTAGRRTSEDEPVLVEREDGISHDPESEDDEHSITAPSTEPLSYGEKQEIARNLPRLPRNQLPEALHIIQDGLRRRMVIAGKLNVDLEELSEDALRQLLELVRSESS